MSELVARVPVQIAVAADHQHNDRLYVLADDGSLWRLDEADVRTSVGQRRKPSKTSVWTRLPGLRGRAASPIGATPEPSEEPAE